MFARLVPETHSNLLIGMICLIALLLAATNLILIVGILATPSIVGEVSQVRKELNRLRRTVAAVGKNRTQGSTVRPSIASLEAKYQEAKVARDSAVAERDELRNELRKARQNVDEIKNILRVIEKSRKRWHREQRVRKRRPSSAATSKVPSIDGSR